MAETILNTRIQLKNDTSENWAKAVNFSPKKGEVIIYSDLNKMKIGDGITNVNLLPFMYADPLLTTESDNGKFLRVVNGVPTWQAVDSAEEASV